jgi:hypothetical protein
VLTSGYSRGSENVCVRVRVFLGGCVDVKVGACVCVCLFVFTFLLLFMYFYKCLCVCMGQ